MRCSVTFNTIITYHTVRSAHKYVQPVHYCFNFRLWRYRIFPSDRNILTDQFTVVGLVSRALVYLFSIFLNKECFVESQALQFFTSKNITHCFVHLRFCNSLHQRMSHIVLFITGSAVLYFKEHHTLFCNAVQDTRLQWKWGLTSLRNWLTHLLTYDWWNKASA